MSGREITDPEVRLLASLSRTLQSDYEQEGPDMWEDSPFAWIKKRPSSSQRGSIAEKLVSAWCTEKGLNVTSCSGSSADRIIGNTRTEIKFSTLWQAGIYKFQQFRNQDYQIAICLGISPFDVHCWVITKELLLAHVIGHTPQHGGREGRDTAWISVSPENPPSWLRPCGGRLQDALGVLQNLVNE